MSRQYIKQGGVYTPVGDTQGLLVPQGVRYTRFKPSNVPIGANQEVLIIPTAAQCVAGGGENWNNGAKEFRVPRAGIYTVTIPAFQTENNLSAGIDALVTSFTSSGVKVDQREHVYSAATPDTHQWMAVDVSVYVPEGGYIQVSFYTADNAGTLDFNIYPYHGNFLIFLNEVQSPYLVANKGNLTSSDAAGKVSIDPDTGEMTANSMPIHLSNSYYGEWTTTTGTGYINWATFTVRGVQIKVNCFSGQDGSGNQWVLEIVPSDTSGTWTWLTHLYQSATLNQSLVGRGTGAARRFFTALRWGEIVSKFRFDSGPLAGVVIDVRGWVTYDESATIKRSHTAIVELTA